MNRKEGGRRKEKSMLQLRKLSLFIYLFFIRDEAYFNLKQSSMQRRLKGRQATAADVCVSCWRFTSWMHGGNQLS